MEGKAINTGTSERAVANMRLDIATTLLRETGMLPCVIVIP